MTPTPAQILTAAHLCNLAYSPKLPRGFCEVGDMRYGIFEEDESRYLVIPGTRNAKNLLRDIWVRPTRTERGNWVHKGFHSAFEKLANVCANQVTANTIAIGHSLGGDTAELFGEALGCDVITFGCARLFLRLMPTPGHFNHLRIVCDDDPVTKIPWFMFRHRPNDTIMNLPDRDGQNLDFEDHGMEIYLRRLKRRYRHVQAVPAFVPVIA